MMHEMTQCAECHKPIRKETAERRFGLCRKCQEQHFHAVPEDFRIDPELARRASLLGEKLEETRSRVWCEGVEGAERHLDFLDERRRHHDEWIPRMRAFAQKCRIAHPIPPHDTLDAADRAKQQILDALVRHGFVSFHDDEATLLCIPLIGMRSLLRHFPESINQQIVWTFEEEHEFYERFVQPPVKLPVLASYRWGVVDLPNDAEHQEEWQSVPPGETGWLVFSFFSYGLGHGHQEVWSWDGMRAKPTGYTITMH